nr:hypothetical protein CFP56_70014 [Quercus suber]
MARVMKIFRSYRTHRKPCIACISADGISHRSINIWGQFADPGLVCFEALSRLRNTLLTKRRMTLRGHVLIGHNTRISPLVSIDAADSSMAAASVLSAPGPLVNSALQYVQSAEDLVLCALHVLMQLRQSPAHFRNGPP